MTVPKLLVGQTSLELRIQPICGPISLTAQQLQLESVPCYPLLKDIYVWMFIEHLKQTANSKHIKEVTCKIKATSTSTVFVIQWKTDTHYLLTVCKHNKV